MDIISRFIATSAILLHVLVILRGQNDLVTAQADTPYIIFGNRVAIHQIRLNGSNRVELQQGPDPNSEEMVDIRGLDFDFNRGTMYWSDVAKAVIMQSRLDGSDVRTIVNTSLIAPENIAWDWINQKLYWTDRVNDTIKVYDPIRNIQKILVNTGPGSQPRAIVVDPSTRYLYWTDWSDVSPRIMKTSMDGANSTVLANGTWVTWPNALAIDYTNQVLYWGDARRDVIGRMNTNGSGIEIIANLMQTLGSNSQPWAMSYFDGHIYWSDWLNGRTVLKMDVSASSTGSIVSVVSGVGGSNAHPTGIHVVDASRQSNVPNPCGDNNGGCSHLCLLSPTSSSGFTCVCPVDLPLNEDGRHCGDLPDVTTTTTMTPPSQLTGPCNTSNPCLNGATCLNVVGMGSTQYFCVCINGYSGMECQISPDVPSPSTTNGDGTSNTVVAIILVFGAIVVVVIVAMVMIIVLYVFYKLKNGKAKERSQSFSALSTTSSRDSPTHIVIYRNGRNQPEHDYASIKSRDSPAPNKGNLLIYSLPNGSNGGNHYVYPQLSESVPAQSFQRVQVLASNGTLNGYMGSSMEKSDSSVKESDTEPFYSNVKTKTRTL